MFALHAGDFGLENLTYRVGEGCDAACRRQEQGLDESRS
jgi:hypothetical protein